MVGEQTVVYSAYLRPDYKAHVCIWYANQAVDAAERSVRRAKGMHAPGGRGRRTQLARQLNRISTEVQSFGLAPVDVVDGRRAVAQGENDAGGEDLRN